MKSINHRTGAIKRWAKKLGLSFEEYLHISQTQKRCQKCKTWKRKEEFPFDTSRYDGLNVRCHSCIKINRPPRWHILNEEEKEKLRERNRKNRWMLGKKLSAKQRQHLREIAIEQKRFVGERSPQWKGGVTPQNRIARNNSKYKEWRKKVFERDNFTCQKCGDKRGSNLNPHHIKSFSEYPELRYEVSNGITHCDECHSSDHDKPLSCRKLRLCKRLSSGENQLKLF